MVHKKEAGKPTMSNKPHNRPSTQRKTAKVQPYDPRNGELQAQLFSIQRMYDQSVLDKASMQNALQQAQAMTAAVLLGQNLDEVFVPDKTILRVANGEIAGLDVKQSKSPKGVKISLVWAPDPEPSDVPL